MREVFKIPSQFYTQMQEKLRSLSKRADPSEVRPSSGFLVVNWLLANGVRRVHLIGFDHFKKQNSRQHHYWLNQKFGRPREHDGDAEAEALSAYEAEGRVIYLVK